MVTNRQIKGGGRHLLEVVEGATTDVPSEARWLVERINGGNGIFSGRGQRGLTFSYACPGWGNMAYSIGGKGGSEKGSWCK